MAFNPKVPRVKEVSSLFMRKLNSNYTIRKEIVTYKQSWAVAHPSKQYSSFWVSK